MSTRGSLALVESQGATLHGAFLRCSALVALLALGACGARSASRPAGPPAQVLVLDRPGLQVVAVAWAAGGPIWAGNLGADGAKGVVEAPGRYTVELDHRLAAMAASETLGVAVVGQEAAANAVLFDPRVGPTRGPAGGPRHVELRATEYLVVTDAATCGERAVITGSFGGTLRVGDQVASTAGKRDGFAAFLGASGQVHALWRLGGDGDDGLAAVACRGDELALAGTFSAGAELRGRELEPVATRSPHSDAVVVLVRGNEIAWHRTFGGAREDLAADVAISDAGEVAVVGMARGDTATGAVTLATQGPADGYLARWAPDGSSRGAARLGGPDHDGATAVLALGERFVVGGFFTGSADDGHGATVHARGGDDAFVAVVDRGVPTVRALSGDGREQVTSLARAGDGVVMAIAHTAGFTAFGATVAAPADPLGGATLLTLTSL